MNPLERLCGMLSVNAQPSLWGVSNSIILPEEEGCKVSAARASGLSV